MNLLAKYFLWIRPYNEKSYCSSLLSMNCTEINLKYVVNREHLCQRVNELIIY